MRLMAGQTPTAMISVENPWSGHFKEHHAVQKTTSEDGFWMIRAGLCAAACETLDGSVHVDSKGKMQETAFPMKPAALPVKHILPFSVQPPRCKGTSCRVKLPGTKSHGILVQSRSLMAQGKNVKGRTQTKSGRMKIGNSDVYSRQAKVPHGYSSTIPLGLFKWMWKQHKKRWPERSPTAH